MTEMRLTFQTYDAMMPLSEMEDSPFQTNKHSPEQIERLALMMREHGVSTPVSITRGTKRICFGHGRRDAAKKNGWTVYPVVYQEFASEDEEQAKVTSDNAIALWAELDFPKINDIFTNLGPDFNVDLLGIKNFEVEPLDKLIGDEDSIPAVPKEASTKIGDLYELGNHRVLCGSSAVITDMDRLIGSEKVDMIFTDPPYGVNYQAKNKMLNSLQSPKGGLETEIHGDDMSLEDLRQMLLDSFSNASTFLAEKSCYYVSAPQGGELGMMMMMMMQEAGTPCRHMIVWVKNNAAFSMGRLDYDYRHEPILYGWMKNKTHEFYGNGEFKNSVWEIDRENNKLHPTMKPVAIMENAIKNSTQQGQLVLDMFSGSGSTLIACEKTARRCVGMEISPLYCDVIVTRFCQLTGTSKIRRNGEEIEWGC